MGQNFPLLRQIPKPAGFQYRPVCRPQVAQSLKDLSKLDPDAPNRSSSEHT